VLLSSESPPRRRPLRAVYHLVPHARDGDPAIIDAREWPACASRKLDPLGRILTRPRAVTDRRSIVHTLWYFVARSGPIDGEGRGTVSFSLQERHGKIRKGKAARVAEESISSSVDMSNGHRGRIGASLALSKINSLHCDLKGLAVILSQSRTGIPWKTPGNRSPPTPS